MKLQLGNIKMDSESGIEFGVTNTDSRQITRVGGELDPHPLETSIEADPPFEGLSLLSLAPVALVGCAFLIVAFFLLPWWLTVILFIALQATTAWFVLTTRAKAMAKTRTRREADLFAEDRARLLKLLAQAQPQTVSQICECLNMSVERALHLVNVLLRQQEIEEDIDVESGHFIYRATEKFYIDADHMSAAERLEQIQQSGIPKELT